MGASAGRSGAGPTFPMVLRVPPAHELLVREVGPDDVDGLVDLYRGLSADDTYRRFFSQFTPTRDWAADSIRRLQAGGFGVVAVDNRTDRIVGEASYFALPNGDGEFALTVDRQWRGWLGPFLLDVLLEAAAARGVPNLEAEVLTVNRPMMAVARRRDAVVAGDSDFQVVHVVIGTTAGQATWPPVHADRRVLVESPTLVSNVAGALDAAGFEVLGCGGPERRHRPCPALTGGECPLAAGADAIVVALPAGRADELVAAHRRSHPDVPVVVIGATGPEDRGASDGATTTAEDRLDAGVCRLESGAPSAALVEALRRRFSD